MDEKKFQKRGWICAALAPIACALFLLGRLAGLWDRTGDQNAAILACVLMAEIAVSAAAPFWWLLTAFRRRRPGTRQSRTLICANACAMLLAVICFF